MNYNGYDIIEVYKYSSGKSDFEVYKEESERGTMHAKTTLEDVKMWIDSITE